MVKYATAKTNVGVVGEANAPDEDEQKKAEYASSNSDSVGSQTRRGFYASETDTDVEAGKKDEDPYGLQQAESEHRIANRSFNTDHKTIASK